MNDLLSINVVMSHNNISDEVLTDILVSIYFHNYF